MPPQKKKDIKESGLAATASVALNGTTTNHNNNNNTLANNNNKIIKQSDVINGNDAGVLANRGVGPVSAAEQLKLNNHQQEQELFLQAFEKPTQIYRFLRNRHGTSPIFLQRTLSYMKERMSRSHKKRQTFKVNAMLDALTEKTQSLNSNFINIIYNGLFEKSATNDSSWQSGDEVAVESTLYKITKSKRKDSTSDFQEVLTLSSSVIYNPKENMEQFSAVSIPAQAMQPIGDQHTIYKLLFRIKISAASEVSSMEISNGETPNSKRSKAQYNKLFGCELIVYEKNIGCIPEGDYEAALQELNSSSIKSFSPKKRSWETLPDDYIPISMKFDVFTQYPTLKFRLTWSAIEVPQKITLIDMEKYGSFNDFLMSSASDENSNDQINHNNNNIKSTGMAKSTRSSLKSPAKTEKIQIVYNFLYSNNTRQQTEYTQEVICPWCGLDCMRLYSLLKHLKLCHARFNFTYQPAASNGARIDVTINDAYDGSYAGSPYDLAGPSGCSFARTCGPVRRTTVTNLLVCRPRRQKTCLDEFLVLDEDDLSNQRPYITGHNRLYHHTETCLPVHPKELDIDSEGESDPLWLRQKTIQMIDEFTDVNEGEKELMKLWNLHVMKHGYVGDCQLPIACEMFLDTNGQELIRRNIYRNFILHMCSLFDYGLVGPETVYKTVQKLQGILSKYSEGQLMMSRQRETQLQYWLEVGIFKQDEQKLKSPQKASTAATTTTASLVATTAVTDAKTENVKSAKTSSMHPPSKRSGTAIKRSILDSNANASSEATPEKSAVLAGNGKSVAKKSASHDDDSHKSQNSIKRQSSSAIGGDNKKSNESKITDRKRAAGDTADKVPASKRRLSAKDVQPPASKRQRSDNNANSQNTTTTTANTRHSLNQKQQENAASTNSAATVGKRLARRQSIGGLPSENSSISNSNNKLSASGKSTAHVLRTRLSVPLKGEKR